MALMLPTNWCLVFFQDPHQTFTTDRVAHLLRSDALTVDAPNIDEKLPTYYGDGPVLHISVHRSMEVETIVRGLLGRRRKYDKYLKGLDSEIRVELQDVAEVLDEINTLIQVQLVLKDATQGLTYLGWNNTFTGPNE